MSQWLSGTRKLNTHYQSGTQVKSSPILYGMDWALHGFQYGRPGGELYGAQYRNVMYHKFYDDLTNITFAPIYKIFDDFPTTIESVETKTTAFASWHTDMTNDDTGTYVYSGGLTFKEIRDLVIWKYGEIEAEPHWMYYQSSDMITWSYETEMDQYVNQNGTDRRNLGGMYYYAGDPTRSFENVYNGKYRDVVIPVFEVLALPAPSLYNYGGTNQSVVCLNTSAIFTNNFGSRPKSKIKLDGFSNPNTVQRVQGRKSNYIEGVNDITLRMKGTDNKIYIFMSDRNGPYKFDEIGCFGSDRDGFWGDCNIKFIWKLGNSGTDPHELISAGYNMHGDEMFYALRPVKFKMANIDPSTLVLPFRYDGSLYR